MKTGFWAGFAGAVDKMQDRKLKKDLLSQQQEEERLNKYFQKISDKRGKLVEKAEERVSLKSRLMGYGLEESVVDSVISTGDTKNIESFIRTLDDQYTVAQQAGRGQQYLETINTTLTNATITPEGTRTISGDELQEYLGMSLEQFGMDMELEVPTQGGFGYVPPVLQEERDIGDYGKLEERIAENAEATANSELRRVNQQISAITQRLESSVLDDNEEKALKDDLSVLMARSSTVGQALEAFSGDEADPFPLLAIYGTQSVNKITSDFTRFDPSKLQPSFQENINQVPFIVQDRDQEKRLREAGVIRENDPVIVTNDNQTQTTTEIPEAQSREEVQAMIDNGTLREGDTVRLNGRVVKIQLED